ncbi:MAG: peptide-methionine (R)-S-oxide reductase MsrB [bacterium]|jgi:peptide-methionine (R)-S-oxide reductase
MTDEEYKKKLTKEQYAILRGSATEPPFSGKFDDFFETGDYTCGACGSVLFKSNTKYDAGCGWPSFWDATDNSKIKLLDDSSLGMHRTEVRCGVCDSHLGHLFNDGPVEHGRKRYCINSGALNFEKSK